MKYSSQSNFKIKNIIFDIFGHISRHFTNHLFLPHNLGEESDILSEYNFNTTNNNHHPTTATTLANSISGSQSNLNNEVVEGEDVRVQAADKDEEGGEVIERDDGEKGDLVYKTAVKYGLDLVSYGFHSSIIYLE